MRAVGFSPTGADRAGEPVAVDAAEAQLGHWFGRPVVLTSSGRAALLLCFGQLGLSRYASRLAMPPRTAQCVFDAVTRAAFPVDPATDRGPVDAALLIHQYGHVLHDRPAGPVVEDICHAFFAAPGTGARDWAGDMAVFSLPKFFPLAGLAGGIVASDAGLADDLRARRDAAPRLTGAQAAADRSEWRAGHGSSLEQVYLRALLHPSPDPAALAGLPPDLAAAGHRRAQVTSAILDAIPAAALDADWRAMCCAKLPYALPVFASPAASAPLIDALREQDYETGLFRIDRARTMGKPDPQPAVLLPCHDRLTEDELSVLIDVLHTWSAHAAVAGGDMHGSAQ